MIISDIHIHIYKNYYLLLRYSLKWLAIQIITCGIQYKQEATLQGFVSVNTSNAHDLLCQKY